MSTTSEPAGARPRGARQFLLVWVAVSAAAVLAHFAFAPRMGLYEDDHWLIGVPMCEWSSLGDVWTAVRGMFAQFFQGLGGQLFNEEFDQEILHGHERHSHQLSKALQQATKPKGSKGCGASHPRATAERAWPGR